MEVALQCVHHDVGATAAGLILRQRIGQLRIQDGEYRSADIIVTGPLLPGGIVGDHTGIAHLAAGRRQREDAAHGIGSCRYRLPDEEVPDIPVRCQAVAHSFGGVNDTAAAYGQDEVHLLLPAELNRFIDLRQPRIRLDTALADIGESRAFHRGFDAVQQSAFYDTAAAVVDQDLCRAAVFQEFSDFIFLSCAEFHPGGGVEGKVLHLFLLDYFIGYTLCSRTLASCPGKIAVQFRLSIRS